jgi:hypothetical protein
MDDEMQDAATEVAEDALAEAVTTATNPNEMLFVITGRQWLILEIIARQRTVVVGHEEETTSTAQPRTKPFHKHLCVFAGFSSHGATRRNAHAIQSPHRPLPNALFSLTCS